jgi:hypothetical protein
LFLKIVSTAKARCPTFQRSMATEMLWVSLEERSRTNSPRQRFHSQLFYKVVRYFCWILYNRLREDGHFRPKHVVGVTYTYTVIHKFLPASLFQYYF